MTLLEAIKAAVPEGYQLHYANLDEANYGLDQINQFPAIIVLPFEVTDEIGASSLLQSSSPLTAFFIDVDTDRATIQVNTNDSEVIVQRCRTAARKFINTLLHSEIIDTSKPFESITYTPVYNQLDKAAHGVSMNTSIHFVEGVSGC